MTGLRCGASLAIVACTIVQCSAWSGEAVPPKKVREMPCPDAPPKFDYRTIDRSLKEPKYGSTKPIYRFFALGPEGKSVAAMVADESKGDGAGVDTIYMDLDCDRDITGPGEKFALKDVAKKNQRNAKTEPDTYCLAFPNWGKGQVGEMKFAVEDPTFDYSISVSSGISRIAARTKDKSFEVPFTIADAIVWSAKKDDAPVIRVGGNEFALKNERFVEAPKGQKESCIGRTFGPGAKIYLEGNAPYFQGSSPHIAWGAGQFWRHGGYRGLKASIEPQTAGQCPTIDLDFHES